VDWLVAGIGDGVVCTGVDVVYGTVSSRMWGLTKGWIARISRNHPDKFLLLLLVLFHRCHNGASRRPRDPAYTLRQHIHVLLAPLMHQRDSSHIAILLSKQLASEIPVQPFIGIIIPYTVVTIGLRAC